MFTFAYVKDVASAFYASYAADRPPRRIYNVGGERATAARAVALAREHFPGAAFAFAGASARHLAYVDGTALRDELGVEPEYDLSAAISDYISTTSRRAAA